MPLQKNRICAAQAVIPRCEPKRGDFRPARGAELRFFENRVTISHIQSYGGVPNMNILVIDGQGGGIGKQVISSLKAAYPDCKLTAVGTNSAATTAMLKAGADEAATGENAVIVNCRTADVIVGPIGIVITDSLLGEITPAIANAVAQSRATRILIPLNRCKTLIAGVNNLSTGFLVQSVLDELSRL